MRSCQYKSVTVQGLVDYDGDSDEEEEGGGAGGGGSEERDAKRPRLA